MPIDQNKIKQLRVLLKENQIEAEKAYHYWDEVQAFTAGDAAGAIKLLFTQQAALFVVLDVIIEAGIEEKVNFVPDSGNVQ